MPWCLPFQTSLGNYAYDTATNSVVSISQDLYELLCLRPALSDGREMRAEATGEVRSEFSFLNQAGYLKDSPLKEIEHPMSRKMSLRLDRQAGMLILQVTQRCNFRCRYCIYSEDNNLNRCHSDIEMSFETAKAAVDFYHAHSVDCREVSISFYGGEPLLRFDLIKRVVEYSESLFEGKEILFRLTTNASLLNEEMIRFFTMEGHKFSVLISLDGPKEIQDSNRRFPNGAGTYDCVINNLHRIADICSDYPSVFSFNAVLDTDNDYEAVERIDEDYFVDACSVQYNFVEKEDRTAPYNPEFLEKINYDLFLGCVSYYRDVIPVYPNKLVEYLIKRNRLQEIRISSGSVGECSAPSGPCAPGAHRLFVDCQGRFFPCERVSEANSSMVIGDIENGFDLAAVYRMLNVSSETKSQCKGCWAFQLCSLCIKSSDCSGTVSARARLELCGQVRRNATDLLNRMVLNEENAKHERKIRHYRVAPSVRK